MEQVYVVFRRTQMQYVSSSAMMGIFQTEEAARSHAEELFKNDVLIDIIRDTAGATIDSDNLYMNTNDPLESGYMVKYSIEEHEVRTKETQEQFIEKVALGKYSTNDVAKLCKIHPDVRDFYASLLVALTQRMGKSLSIEGEREVGRLSDAVSYVEIYLENGAKSPVKNPYRAASPDKGDQTPTQIYESLPEADLPRFSEVKKRIAKLSNKKK